MMQGENTVESYLGSILPNFNVIFRKPTSFTQLKKPAELTVIIVNKPAETI